MPDALKPARKQATFQTAKPTIDERILANSKKSDHVVHGVLEGNLLASS